MDNRGSLRTVVAVQASEYKKLMYDPMRNMDDQPKVDVSKVILIPNWAGQKYLFEENQSMADHGKRFEVVISGSFPTGMIAKESVEVLRDGEWVVAHQDTMGRWRVSGTDLVPLSCSVSETSGSELPDTHAYTFEFTGIEADSSVECYVLGMFN